MSSVYRGEGGPWILGTLILVKDVLAQEARIEEILAKEMLIRVA